MRWFIPRLLTALVAVTSPAVWACDAEALAAVPEPQRVTTMHLLALRACLASPDPAVRDDFAYARFVAVMRSGEVSPDTLETLLADFVFRLSVPERGGDGFEAPFLVLVLAEIARVDRVSPYLDDKRRKLLVDAAWRYLRGVTDYRGFKDGEGWRHGVAHGADLAMQLALNPELSAEQGAQLLAAIATQVAPASGHNYVFNEPGRLARPVFFLAMNERVSAETLDTFFSALTPDAGQPLWQSPYGSEAGLAALHNTRAFAQALYVYTATSPSEQAAALKARAEALIRALP
ncbi:MAG: DUF2785 domain-containing protein [Pseudomonadota bacterium]